MKKRFNVDYMDTSDDLSHVWVMAEDAAEAEEYVKEEYWNIKEIIQVYPSR